MVFSSTPNSAPRYRAMIEVLEEKAIMATP
jgi:hypothetical protein